MFVPTGEATETVDVMQHLWKGCWPEFRSPHLQEMWLDGKTARQNVHLNAGNSYKAKVQAQSADHSPLTYSWEIMEESSAQSTGGDFEEQPKKLPGMLTTGAAGEAQIKAPVQQGAYRLFVYAFNGHGQAAYANIPFYVDTKTSTIAARP